MSMPVVQLCSAQYTSAISVCCQVRSQRRFCAFGSSPIQLPPPETQVITSAPAPFCCCRAFASADTHILSQRLQKYDVVAA